MGDRRWIGFDLGGTLIRARREERLLVACSDEGATRARIELALQRIDRYFMQEEPEAWHRADDSFCASYARLLANRLGLHRAAAELAPLVRPTDWVPFADTESELDRLAAAGYSLALVTTWGAGARPLLRSLGLAACFDVLAISGELGRAKPDPLAFWPLVEAAGPAADQTPYIGDNYWDDVVGAWRAGLQPALLDRLGADPEPMSGGYPVLRSLAEVDRPGRTAPRPIWA